MAKAIGKIKESAKDIKSIERYVDFSIRGNSNQVAESDPDLYQMINDYSVYLSDKEFLDKWYDKKKFTGMHTEEEFDEFGTMEEFGVNEEYYITFKDGSEIHVLFKLPDGDFMFADSRDAEKGTMAEKYIREYEMDEWDIDIDSLVKEVSGGKMANGGEATGLKVENEKDLQDVAKYMVKAVKKNWDLKDLIYYFEKDNNFDYKVRGKAATREEIYEMPKNYESILKLLKGIVEANGKELPMEKGGLTPAKARKMLHEGVAHGKPITEQQRKYFGAVATGYAKKEKGGEVKKGLYATGQVIDGVIVVDADKEFDDNPLFYVYSEYPTNKKINKEGRLLHSYEFYTDKAGNKYLITSHLQNTNAKELIAEKKKNDPDWNWARNVDEFVEGADADSYARWLDLISHDGGEMKAGKGERKSLSDGIFWLITGDIF